MCLNQAIDKLQREMFNLTDTRNSIIQIMEDQVESEKLSNLLKQMRTQHHFERNQNRGVAALGDNYGTFSGQGLNEDTQQ